MGLKITEFFFCFEKSLEYWHPWANVIVLVGLTHFLWTRREDMLSCISSFCGIPVFLGLWLHLHLQSQEVSMSQYL